MSAGASALRMSQQYNQDADGLFSLAQVARQKARAYQAAWDSEASLADLLRPLNQLGWHVLEDRLWPGSKRANVDFLLVGPGGLVVVDAKSWADVTVTTSSIFRGESCENEQLEKLDGLMSSLADALAPVGLTRAACCAVMCFTSRSIRTVAIGPVTVCGDEQVITWLAGLRHRFNEEQTARVLAAVDACCPEMPEPSRGRLIVRPRHRASTTTDETVQGRLIDAEEMTQALVNAALQGPVEEWMTFLHPEQNKLISAQWNGPARVRGPAGTGKTVVGLHRAVYLAERATQPVLFVSFVKTLPVVLSALAERISTTAAANIEFVGVHRLAMRCLGRAGRSLTLDPAGCDSAFKDAWTSLSAAAQSLMAVEERAAYWREEIDYVIKGRGLETFADYRSLTRVGRKTPMRESERQHMWDVYEAYQSRLQSRGLSDFNDLLFAATFAVEEFPELCAYSSVVVDEVQDLNLVALKFLVAMMGAGPNPLLLLGDGQQSVYPGGFTLSEAGISVAGRGRVLTTNYRNTHEIIKKAAAQVNQDTFDDLDGEASSGSRQMRVNRHGPSPLEVVASTDTDLDSALTSIIARTRSARSIPWGDIAVLVQHRKDLLRYQRVLRRAGVPYVELTEYDGITTDRVKIGTIKRAKGLEFKFVLMPGLREGDPDSYFGESDSAYAERCERHRRELYVGMTRARDGLWLGYLRKTSAF